MTEMQQMLAGMCELNDKVQQAEARATEEKIRRHSRSLQDCNKLERKGKGRAQQTRHNR